ncbi:MAG: 30S ribosomal protein S2 [Phycisphaerales bacterium]|nr:MAG: 30S ribosomal protein S2 [Phycisphaerales bacterium]
MCLWRWSLASEVVRQLIDAGIHYGHRVSRWNPKMRPYIYRRHNLIHIIDIKETVRGLLYARKFLANAVGDGGDVLFVGTKRQARQAIRSAAERVGMHYVCERWLGGTLTNFRTIRSRLTRLEELEALEESGQISQFGKKMMSSLTREKNKIKRNLDGIRKMSRLPAAVVVIDVRREHIAVKEAKKLGIATVCLIDTDSDPDYADIPIPGNDDAIRAIELIVGQLADAVEEGLKGRAVRVEEDGGQGQRRRSRRPTTARAVQAPKAEEKAPEVPAAMEPPVAAEQPGTPAPEGAVADAPSE